MYIQKFASIKKVGINQATKGSSLMIWYCCLGAAQTILDILRLIVCAMAIDIVADKGKSAFCSLNEINRMAGSEIN